MAFVTRKVLNGLIDIFFSGSPEESVGAAIKLAVDHVGGDKAWEQIFIDSLQAAIKDPSLQHYARTDGAIGLDLDLVKRAFHAELSIYDAAESDIRSPIFLEKLVDRFVELDALYVGGEQLSEDDRRHVITVVIKRLAPQYFKQFVETNESAFRQALRREALKTNTRLEVIDVYLRDHYAIVVGLLTEIRDDTKAIREAVVEALAGREPAAKPKPRRVFISYARKDHADEGRDPDCFVQKLYRALKAAGFTPFLDHTDMPSSGAPFPKEQRDAIQDSEYLIAVCSPSYPASVWCQAERDHAYLACTAIVPVRAAGEFDSAVPDDIKDQRLNVIPMDSNFDDHWPSLFARIETTAQIPGKVIDPAGVMPEFDESDIPRTALFEQISTALRKDQTDPIAITGTRTLTAMYAAGGVGKTTLAAQVARDCSVRRGFPDGVIWMRLGETDSDPDTLRVRLGSYLGMEPAKLTGARGAADFVQVLHQLDALIILDDAWSKDQVDSCHVDGPNLRYLITTRLASLANRLKLPNENRIKVDNLTPDEGIALIAHRLGIDPNTEYAYKSTHRAIVETLKGHTQAIDIVAGHLRPRVEGGSGPDYAPILLAQLQKSDNTLFDLLMRSVDDDSREGNLLRSLSVSYEMLPTKPDDLKRLFRLLAVFVPGGSFDHIAAAAVWDINDPERARRRLNELVGRSLVNPSDEVDRYSLHVLIHAAARVLLAEQPEADAAGRHARHYADLARAQDTAGMVGLMRTELPQLKHALEWSSSARNLVTLQALLTSSARLLQQPGEVDGYFRWSSNSVSLAETLGDPVVLGSALTRRGNSRLALSTVNSDERRERLYLALADFEDALNLQRHVPPEMASTLRDKATTLAKLAEVDGENRRVRLMQALSDLNKALELGRDESFHVAATLNARGNVYRALAPMDSADRQLRLQQAIEDYTMALAMRSEAPLDLALTLSNRATAYADLSESRGDNRRERLHQALADLDRAIQLQHDVPLSRATTLTNRANIQGQLSSMEGENRRERLLTALADYNEALTLRRDVPLDRAVTLNNRAKVYGQLALIAGEDRRTRLLQALADYNEALGVRRDAPLQVATILSNRAIVYRALASLEGEDQRTRLYQALADYDAALAVQGDVPLDKARTLNNRGRALRDMSVVQGEDRRARLYQALVDFYAALELLGDLPLDMATTLYNRATVFSDLSLLDGEDQRARLYQALADFDVALQIRQERTWDRAGTLGARAAAGFALSQVEGEDRIARLRRALDDAIQAFRIYVAEPHGVDLKTARRNLLSICRHISDTEGVLMLETWWSEYTSGQPLPEWLRPPPNVSISDEESVRVVDLLNQWMQHYLKWTASKAFLHEHKSDLLSEAASSVLWKIIHSNPDIAGFERHAALLRRAREVGIDVAYAPLLDIPRSIVVNDEKRFEQLGMLVIEWVGAPDWSVSKAFLREHSSELLSHFVDNKLWELIQLNPGWVRLVQHRDLLRQAREVGIDAAYEQFS